MKMNKTVLYVSVILTFILSSCGPGQLSGVAPSATPTSTPISSPTTTVTPTSSPTLTPTPIIYDGDWTGKTEQGYPVSFTIEDNTVTKYYIKYGNAAVGCSIEINYDIKNDKSEIKPKLENGKYEFISDSDVLMIELIGIFNPSGEASGTFKARTKQCDNVNTTWEASRK
jgi:hypothetical protein